MISTYKNIITAVIVIVFVYVFYTNSAKIIDWFKSLFTNITKNDTPTIPDLSNPNYVISTKIIQNYVDIIDTAVNQLGTDEKLLDDVFKNLKNNDIANTIAVWNEFNNRKHKYNTWFGDYNMFLGNEYNLYQVLEYELKNTDDEKRCLVNWKWLFHRAGLI